MPDKPYLSVKQVCEMFQVSKSTVYSLVERGKIPHVRFGGRRGGIRFDQRELLKWVRANGKEK